MQLPLVVFTAQTQTGGLDASAEREGSLTGYVGVLCSCVGLSVGVEVLVQLRTARFLVPYMRTASTTAGRAGTRSRADLNRDRWIQSPEC